MRTTPIVQRLYWFSRFVVSWKLSNTLDGWFCQEALGRGTPEVFNTDQGVQFTARAWTARVESAGVSVSMDGRGRCLDNVFVERLWRSVKYEYVYPSGPESVRWSAVWVSTSGSTTALGFTRLWNAKRPRECIAKKAEDLWRSKKRER